MCGAGGTLTGYIVDRRRPRYGCRRTPPTTADHGGDDAVETTPTGRPPGRGTYFFFGLAWGGLPTVIPDIVESRFPLRAATGLRRPRSDIQDRARAVPHTSPR